MSNLSRFERKLIRLILEETKGETIESGLPSGTTGEICASMAGQLGKFIALQCGGNAQVMSMFLDGANNFMFESAADTSKAGQFLADPENWFAVGPDGTTVKMSERKIVYDETHWFNQEMARLMLRLMQERGTKQVNGQTCLSAAYDPDMTGMVMTTLSEMLGKMVVMLTNAGQDTALMDKLLEGASHNAFETATKFKARIVEMPGKEDS